MKALVATYNEFGYSIWLDPKNFYCAGNHPLDSTQNANPEEALPLETIKQYCEETAQELAEEWGAQFNGVEYDSD